MQTKIKLKKESENFDVDLLKSILKVMLFVLVIVSTLDLYVPLKMWILGDTIYFSDLFSYIKLRHHIPYILIIGFVAGFFWDISIKENSNKKKTL